MATINSIGTSKPIEISNGGTGRSILTAYSVLLGNGTSAVSTVASVGTADQVLTSNGAGAAPTWQDAASPTISINAQTGTTYTLVLTDASKLITMTNTSGITLTIPLNSSIAFDIGTQILITQLGTGNVTVAVTSGVTLRSAASDVNLNQQYSVASLIKIASDTWLLTGDTN